MTTSPDPWTVADLPSLGPATVQGVKNHAKITDARDDALLDDVVAAVNAKVRSWPCCEDVVATGEDAWPATAKDVVLGATMLAARLFRRRNSPAGVEAFSDQGAVYVSRNDPDVALLLGLGAYAKPRVG